MTFIITIENIFYALIAKSHDLQNLTINHAMVISPMVLLLNAIIYKMGWIKIRIIDFSAGNGKNRLLKDWGCNGTRGDWCKPGF